MPPTVAEWGIDRRGVESLKPEGNGTHAPHGVAGVRAALIVLTVTATTAEPGEGAFDHPAFGPQDDACAARRPPHEVHVPVARRLRFYPRMERMMRGRASGPYHGHARIGGWPHGHRPGRAAPASSMAARVPTPANSNPRTSTRTGRVRPGRLLPPSSPRLPPGAGVFTDGLARLTARGVGWGEGAAAYGRPRAIVAPRRNLFIARPRGQQRVGSPVPLAARAVEVAPCVDDCAPVDCPWAPSWCGRRNPRRP
jgi:hypothetical protein